MRTHVEFRSSKFAPQDGEDQAVNPGRFGRGLAEYLRARLAEQGVETGDVVAEDWGYVIPVKHEAFKLWIGCGNYEEYPDGFLCFIEPSKTSVRRFLRRIDTTADVTRVAEALDRILGSDAAIQAVRWWTEGEAGA